MAVVGQVELGMAGILGVLVSGPKLINDSLQKVLKRFKR